MNKALILGCNGQDGFYAVRRLVQRGYRALGVDRQAAPDPGLECEDFEYSQLDLRRTDELAQNLAEWNPDLIVHLAAVHLSAGGQYEELFGDMLKVNVASVHTILEYMRRHPSNTRLVYASSAKVFGSPLPLLVDETTARQSQCLYSVTKNAAHDAIEYYRKSHGVQASVLFLFNHESRRRPEQYFIPKLARAIAAAVQGDLTIAEFHTLDFCCDWGSAQEYMLFAMEVAERAIGEDFVVARGEAVYARELVQSAFRARGLDYRDHLREKIPTESEKGVPYKVSVKKLERYLGRSPETSIEELLAELVTERLAGLRVSADMSQ